MPLLKLCEVAFWKESMTVSMRTPKDFGTMARVYKHLQQPMGILKDLQICVRTSKDTRTWVCTQKRLVNRLVYPKRLGNTPEYFSTPANTCVPQSLVNTRMYPLRLGNIRVYPKRLWNTSVYTKRFAKMRACTCLHLRTQVRTLKTCKLARTPKDLQTLAHTLKRHANWHTYPWRIGNMRAYLLTPANTGVPLKIKPSCQYMGIYVPGSGM